MINENIKANKYASAIFKSYSDRDGALKELSDKVDMINQKGIKGFLSNPKVPKEDKIKLMSKDIKILKEFFNLISKMGDILLIPLIEEHLINFVHRSRGIIKATVHVTSKVSDEDLTYIREFFEKSLNKKIIFTKIVNENLIAGIKIEIVGQIIDYSIQNDLNKISNLKVK